MNAFRVTYTDGTSYITNANGTLDEFFKYITQAPHVSEDPVTGKETRRYVKKVADVTAELKARDMIAQRSTYQLISDFEETDKGSYQIEIFRVREWLMDELEKRDKAAFDAWLDSAESSPRKSYIGE